MSAVITTQQQQTIFKTTMRSAIKNAVKARNSKRRLHKRSLKTTLKELRKTTKKVAVTSTNFSIKKKLAKKAAKKDVNKQASKGDKRIYRLMEKLIMKKSKQVKAKVWRSEKLYKLKAGEKWLDTWAIDTRKPTKGSHIRVTSRPTVVEEELVTVVEEQVTIVDIAVASDMVEASQAANEIVEAAKILTEG
tara:strand:+ start:291 stop:863 length:573 start_codon:yes stop_codon:yes gene_type:complete